MLTSPAQGRPGTSSHASPSPPQPAAHDTSKPAQTHAVTKRKQSKSRNGCITCKAKRLKCDETKPTCQQCARRAVTCGGYKKDFKWRAFEEPSAPPKPPAKLKKDTDHAPPPSAPPTFHQHPAYQESQFAFSTTPQSDYYPPPPNLPLQTSFTQTSFQPDRLYPIPQSSPFTISPQSVSPVDSFAPSSIEVDPSVFGAESVITRRTKATTASSVSSGQSPRLVDLLLPGTDLTLPPEEYSSFVTQHGAFYTPTGLTPPPATDDDIEEIPRTMNRDHEAWVMRLPSPSSSSSSSPSPDTSNFHILRQPQFSLTSPETLTRRFDRDTCGVLSVKDGPTENPWRTLIWPLTRDCPALYHAIASMTSFHQSKDQPVMRIHGIDHMRSAVHALAGELGNMRFDAAISTTLVLAFSESWDQHISTGINHIKGAKLLINQALVQHSHTPKKGDDWARLKFLCNTWIYMDVIARLTSADEDESNEVDAVREKIYAAGEMETSLDPLMGCATTLFPIIGRVANLVRKVRRTSSNGPSIISQAVQLKAQLEDWAPPSYIEDPEDDTTSPHDSIKTALAYQYATLLYLHQAVPEIPSQPSGVLAKKVLCELAVVLPRSRSVIVHIYPLLAAGCEATEPEDRTWVKERWGFMASRMKLGILERCLEVTKEVWARRDELEADRIVMDNMRRESSRSESLRSESFTPEPPSHKRDFESFFDDFEPQGEFCYLDVGPKRRVVDALASRTVLAEAVGRSQMVNSNMELLEHEVTVKGRAHWLGVMKDWNWEVLLG